MTDKDLTDNSNASSAIEAMDQSKNSKADIFMNTLTEGYITSLGSHQLPITISDKALSGKVPSNMSVSTTKRDGWVITHNAAAIVNQSTGEVEHYYATKSAAVLLDSIWELISKNKCGLTQVGNTFTITYRKQDLRMHLESIHKSRSGKQLILQHEILEKSVLEINNTSNRNNIKLTGTYFQSAYEIESDDPRLDGLYRATLHPVLADDLLNGRFRDVEKTFLAGSSEANEFYKALIHKMRHEFTNAEAFTDKVITFTLFFGDLLFSSGKVDVMTQGAMRKAINVLRSKLVENDVIAEKSDLKSEWVFDAEHRVNDYQLTVYPTLSWGKSQYRSNAKYKQQQELIKRASNKSLEEIVLVESQGTKIKKLN